MADASSHPPLYVDLDGTLFPGDTLWESAFLLLRERPLVALTLPLRCLAGPAAMKRWLSLHVVPDVTLLPYRPILLDRCRIEHRAGRRLVLATAAHERIAHAVAEHLGCFDAVIATNETNMKGVHKLQAIQQDARGPFWYAGDCSADLPIWRAASGAIVTGSAAQWNDNRLPTAIIQRVTDDRYRLHALAKALRPHQWVKNLLVFLPLLAAHQVFSVEQWQLALIVFVAFCLCASSVYVLNDILDIENDRSHDRKRHRPFAAAVIPVALGVTVAPLLVATAMALAWYVSRGTAAVLVMYYLATFAYSIDLKRRVLLDVFVLAGLYGMRVVAGAVAIDVSISPWLMAFTSFFFLSLALGKRAAELRDAKASGGDEVKGRGWQTIDLPFVTAAGIAAAFTAALVVGLYVTGSTAQQLYSKPVFLFGTIPVILWWCCRFWLEASRGGVRDDPVVYAINDRGTWVVVALLSALFLAAGPRIGH